MDAIGSRISTNEVGHINESLKNKYIPKPKLLIKDHNKYTIKGDFPTRLVIPATNFSPTFAKVVYLGLKNINEVNYTKFTIVLTKNPAIHCKIVPETHCIWYEVNSTNIWREIFWIRLERYQNKRRINRQIQIGFSCRRRSILPVQKLDNEFKEVLWKGIYRDNGLLLFKDKKSFSEIKICRDNFQIRVNKIAGNEYLEFTFKICIPNASPSRDKQDNVSEIASNTFPYQDIEFFWNTQWELEYQVHQKPNQKLKYLNKVSTHTNAMCNAIPSGIFNRLANITSRTNKNVQIKMDERYQGHVKALSKSGLDLKIFPTLK